jgi:ADP-heptose:LPS heptosyltransferase
MGGTLTHQIVRAPEWSMAQWNWEMARAILAAVDDARDWPATPPAPNLSHLVDEKSGRTKQVVVHAGSNQPHTRWPLERFVELASRLARDHRVLWIETPETRAAILPGNIVRIETPNLTALARALASAALFVGNNSGPMHVAVALGTPSVVVSGASAYAWDSPWHREKVQLLRTPNLACLPCEAAEHSPGRCINDREPLACLKRWDVAALEAACRNSLLRWAGV